MSDRLRNTLTVMAIVVMAAVTVALVVTSPSEADRVERIGTQIKCPVCQGESIANSPAPMARDMMALIEERVDQGVSDDAIVDELLASYSGAVLLDPPAQGSTLLLWVLPGLAVLAGLGMIVWWRSHPAPRPAAGDEGGTPGVPQPRSRRRLLIGGLILAGGLAGAIAIAGLFVQDDEGPAAGVANLEGTDLSQVSNETMEAVIAANLNNPQVSGMRLALAERYFDLGDYRSAFPHYLAVAESPDSSATQVATALTRLGWMAWDGNGEAETAIDLFDQALAIEDSFSTARYLKGRVQWCGLGDNAAAGETFAEVLANPDLDQGSRDLVSDDLEAVNSGQSCP